MSEEMTEEKAREIVEKFKHLEIVMYADGLQDPIYINTRNYAEAKGFLAGLAAGRSEKGTISSEFICGEHERSACPKCAEELAQVKADAQRYREALGKINTLDPENSSQGYHDEWSEAECFHKSQVIADEALTPSEEKTNAKQNQGISSLRTVCASLMGALERIKEPIAIGNRLPPIKICGQLSEDPAGIIYEENPMSVALAEEALSAARKALGEKTK